MAVIKRTQKQKNFIVGELSFKRLIKVKYLLLCLLLGMFYYAYLNWNDWLEKLDNKPISAFALVGTPQFTTYTDIRDQIVDVVKDNGFFRQDVDIVREQIESMPWIKGAVVRKIWPDRLSILVAEYTPVAYWNKDQLVSADGTIFKLPLEKLKNANMPRLFGPDYQSLAVLNAWHRIYQDLKAKQLNLKTLSLDERGAWEVMLDNDIILKLGRGEWKDKLDRFVTIYPQIEVPENQKIDYVDLRYKVGAAVSFTKVK